MPRKFVKRYDDYDHFDNVNDKLKIKQLPEPYNRLALLRATADNVDVNTCVIDAFVFGNSPEGADFWWNLIAYDLPAIPWKSRVLLENEFVEPNIN
jgi:hypothetical protein